MELVVKEICPSELGVEKANREDDQANYLDLTFIIGNNNRIYTKLYDKRDDVNFHSVNFPFLSSNIPFMWCLRFTSLKTSMQDAAYIMMPWHIVINFYWTDSFLRL